MLVIRMNFTQSITELFGTSGQVIIIVLMSLTGVLLLVFLMLLGILPRIYTWLYNRREKGFLKSTMESYRFLLLED